MWIEAKTAEGVPYFFHSSTRETRWEPPTEDASLEAAEAAPAAAGGAAAGARAPKRSASVQAS